MTTSEISTKFEDLFSDTWNNFVPLGRNINSILGLANLERDKVDGIGEVEKKMLSLWQQFARLQFDGETRGEPAQMSVELMDQLFYTVFNPEKVQIEGLEQHGLKAATCLKSIVEILGSDSDPIERGNHYSEVGLSELQTTLKINLSQLVEGDLEDDQSKYSSPRDAFAKKMGEVVNVLRENAKVRFPDLGGDNVFIDRVALLIASRMYLKKFAEGMSNRESNIGNLQSVLRLDRTAVL